MDDNKVMLICSRCYNPPAVEGSTKEACSRCGYPVWTSPATRKQAEGSGREVAFVCVQCSVDVLITKDVDIELPNEESLLEMTGALNKMSGNVN